MLSLFAAGSLNLQARASRRFFLLPSEKPFVDKLLQANSEVRRRVRSGDDSAVLYATP